MTHFGPGTHIAILLVSQDEKFNAAFKHTTAGLNDVTHSPGGAFYLARTRENMATASTSSAVRKDVSTRNPISASTISQYYKDVSRLPVNSQPEEQSMARDIERLEITLWRVILSSPRFLVEILDLVESTLTKGDESEVFQEKMISKKFSKCHFGASSAKAYTEWVSKVAMNIRRRDPDRKALDHAIKWLEQAANAESKTAAEPLTVATKQLDGFSNYMRKVRTLNHAAIRARKKFVEANLRLVITIARKHRDSHLNFEELVQEGNIGLIKAVGRFDPHRGLRFSTYAAWWIRHSITRAIADKGRLVRVPVHTAAEIRRVDKMIHHLAEQLGRTPTKEEISQRTQLSLEEVDDILLITSGQSFSLEQSITNGSRMRFIDALEDEDSLNSIIHFEDRQLMKQVRHYLGSLTEKERNILYHRFGLNGHEEQTLSDIGHHHDLSRERIRQIQEEALLKLRKRIKRELSI